MLQQFMIIFAELPLGTSYHNQIFDFDMEHTQFLSEQSHVLHELRAKEQNV
jgi:hypothetical protein